MNFDEHIVQVLYNEYGGSEQKATVILSDAKQYLLKMPDATRELHREVSYINNAISEYIACHILGSMGFDVQNTILGKYTVQSGKEKIVCACEDVRHFGERMYELDKIALSSEDFREFGRDISFKAAEQLLTKIKEIPIEVFREFYYDLFIGDALISNPDRHNGNIAFLSNGSTYRISPVFDCGSSLCPLFGDDEISVEVGIKETMNACSVIKDEQGHRINYHNYITMCGNNNVCEALKRIVPKINLDDIFNIIDTTPHISDARKRFYRAIIETRYEKTFIPALRKMFISENELSVISDDTRDCFDYYKKYIDPIKQVVKYGSIQTFTIADEQRLRCSKAGKNNVLCYDENEKYIGILPVRSNNDDVRFFMRAVQVLRHNKRTVKLV